MPIRPELRKFYGHTWRKTLRPETLARDCYECVRCGMPDRPMSTRSILEVAHLDANPANRGLENRATFCHRCHRSHDYAEWSSKYRAWLIVERERKIDRLDAERPILMWLKEAV
jgi:5-methylcytosine-specific restriction endonuclease McrA